MHILSPALDKQHPDPLYVQLYEHIKRDIMNGTLHTGIRLPSIRNLAHHLHISRNTVETAYQQLLAEGYIVSKPKSGMYVNELDLDIIQQKTPPSPSLHETSCSNPSPDLIDFEYGSVDMSAFPMNLWKKYSNQAYKQEMKELTSYGHHKGEYLLRKEIAAYLYQARGVDCSPEQIIITSGTQHSLNLLCETVFKNYDHFAIENPGYDRARYVFENHGFRVTPISLDKDGLSIKHLRTSRANIVYVTPSHQYPQGMVMPFNRRLELLQWAEETNGYIIEDDYDGEFRYEGKPIPALKELDQHEAIIYLGTFSKMLLPSLRISYIVLPQRLVQTHDALFEAYISTVPRVIQYTLYFFMKDGEWDRHVRRMRLLYQKKHRLLVDSLIGYFGENVEIIGDKAGLHLLIKMDTLLTEKELIEKAEKFGVHVYSIDKYRLFPETEEKPLLLLGFSQIPIAQIEEGIKRLKEAWFD
ncbi:MocR-like pyridoxine biosynthesis transcription factor PdxR [Priestia abyssalis]|uniref:MocR-like pyridoxine biosynthesis transcription factor PdxR n=1 Tax=Priestia abyssalis TaxID=1221450 RepID=UPI0009959B38|nr:PLP-dependent aminotransferase family protein [Priestia abyssalis]